MTRCVGFHVGSEDGVDPGLVALALPFEPAQHVGIQSEGHHLLAFRHADLRVPKEVLVQFRNLGRVDLGVRRSRQFLPVSPRLLCSIRPSHRSSADPIRTAYPQCIYKMYVRQEEFGQGNLASELDIAQMVFGLLSGREDHRQGWRPSAA